jgi:predicted unusual protein kinase regulating ubiquinone biosynthesis (AarF/ABC1/UbiB family)
VQEAEFLNAYRTNLRNDPRFIVPFVVDELTDQNILVMEYIEGSAITDISTMSTDIVDRVCTQLMHLTYQELFTHKLMQSDPNFANFLYQSDTQKIVLLDFGACRQISQHTSRHYLSMADAMQRQNTSKMRSALYSLGLIDNNMSTTAIDTVLQACFEASDCLQSDTGYNLKEQQLIKRIQNITIPLITEKAAAASPIFEVALVNRKITGMILLANKLGATLDFKSALAPYLIESTKHASDEI